MGLGRNLQQITGWLQLVEPQTPLSQPSVQTLCCVSAMPELLATGALVSLNVPVGAVIQIRQAATRGTRPPSRRKKSATMMIPPEGEVGSSLSAEEKL